MTNFGNKLQNYAEGKAESCEHPIIWVDDNRFCHQCNQYVPIRKPVDMNISVEKVSPEKAVEILTIELKIKQDTIAELRARIAKLEAAHEMQGESLVVLPRWIVSNMEDKLKEQAEEIRTLKKPCILFQQVGDQ